MKRPATAGAGLTQERVRELLEYRPDTGKFTWKCSTSNRAPVGAEAGSLASNGYVIVGVEGSAVLAHRLAWLWVYGELPDQNKDIDHIDGDRGNNRISNLRLVTRSANISGGRGRKNPVLPGVAKTPSGRYVAAIHVNRVRAHIGTFDTPEEAHAAHVARHIELFGENSKFHPNHPKNMASRLT